MSQMYGLAKASAIHRRILYPQNQGKQGEEQQQNARHQRSNSGADSGQEGESHDRLKQGEKDGCYLG